MHAYPINQYIPADSPLFEEIHAIVAENAPKIAELSGAFRTQGQIRSLFADITQSDIPDDLRVRLPLYSDFGRHIRIGRGVFINSGAMFTDLGGITLEDHVLIAPRVNILTVNHPEDTEKRHGLILKPVVIKKNAWIGAGATILPGVTVGENAIVAAGSVVAKDVPPDTIVAGVPAKAVRKIRRGVIEVEYWIFR